jgi:hypothetical protein
MHTGNIRLFKSGTFVGKIVETPYSCAPSRFSTSATRAQWVSIADACPCTQQTWQPVIV